MPIWIFRISCLVIFPILVFNFLIPDAKGVAVGLICAIILIAAEIAIRSVSFITIMMGFFGILFSYVIYMLLDYVMIQIGDPKVLDIWADFQDEVLGMLVILGGFVSILKSKDLLGISKKGKHLKVLDPSILMDGRIIDVCRSDFLEGTLVIPKFVLDELKDLSASDEPLQKAKGKRGLDIISQLQEKKLLPIRIVVKDAKGENTSEKVVNLARSLNSQILTMDFNINKLAIVHDISVLNLNDLTSALKPVVLPGESISLFIMKEGKEKEQGIGYLDDGTMVVIEDGRRFIGKKADIDIYSILQTPAGRMIFAKIKREKRDRTPNNNNNNNMNRNDNNGNR